MATDNTIKICPKCDKAHPLAEYTSNVWCLSCNRDYKHAWYTKNKLRLNPIQRAQYKQNSDVVKARVKKYRNTHERQSQFRDRLKLIQDAKDKPCVDCGNRFPLIAMDFDHVPGRGKKLFNITLSQYRSVESIKKEMTKCEVVCSNCHRVRSHRRKQHITVSQPKAR